MLGSFNYQYIITATGIIHKEATVNCLSQLMATCICLIGGLYLYTQIHLCHNEYREKKEEDVCMQPNEIERSNRHSCYSFFEEEKNRTIFDCAFYADHVHILQALTSPPVQTCQYINYASLNNLYHIQK